MTQPIDVAYVDIVARAQGLKREIKSIVENDAKDLERSFNDATKNIDKDFQHTQVVADKSFRKISDDGKLSANKIDRSFRSIFNDIDHGFVRSRGRVRGFFKGFEEDFGDVERSFRRRFFDPLERGFTQLQGVVGQLGQAFGQLASGLFGIVGSSPLAALIIGLIGPIIGLAAALGDLLGLVGLLPGGLLILVSAIAPVIIGFQNFGAAVSALASGDITKIDEAMKKLAPSARVVAREVAGLIPLFKDLQLAVQQSLFTPLIGGVSQLGNVLIPTLKRGLMGVAAAFGTVIRGVLDFLSLAEQVDFINNLFGTTQRLVARFGPALISFIQGFFEVASRTLPVLEKIGNALIDAFGRFGDFMTESARNGSLDKFVGNALKTLKELWGLLKAIGGLFGTLFDATDKSGHDLIVTLTDAIVRLDDFLKSARGKETIDILVLSIKTFGAALEASVEVIAFLGATLHMQLGFLEKVGRGFVKVAKAVGGFFTDVWKNITAFFDALPGFFERIPAAIGTALSNAFDAVFTSIGIAIGIGLFIIEDLPNVIARFIMTIPDRISQALSGGTNVLGDFFQKVIDTGLKILQTGWDNIIKFIMSVPDRIKALGPQLLQAGIELIKAFMNGFRSANRFIGDVAGDIVQGIKGFINKAIDKINEGIAIVEKAIDRVNQSFTGPAGLFIPATHLGRIPHLAQGAVIAPRPGGVLANVAEAGETEVVAPLSKLKSLIADATGGIVFGSNSINVNVNFSGVVPTAQEATDTGRAVGNGIIDAIARRNIRAQVRAI